MKTIILQRNKFIRLIAIIATCIAFSVSCEQEPVEYLPPEYLLISGSTSVTANSTVNYYTFYLDNTTYNWSVPAGATITQGQGTSQIKVKFGTTSGTISVEANGMTASKTVTVN